MPSMHLMKIKPPSHEAQAVKRKQTAKGGSLCLKKQRKLQRAQKKKQKHAQEQAQEEAQQQKHTQKRKAVSDDSKSKKKQQNDLKKKTNSYK